MVTESEVAGLYKAGMTLRQISKELRVRQPTVSKIAKALGLPMRRGAQCSPQNWVELFWPKVKVSGETDCWPWLASTNLDGYGRFSVNGKRKQAHHVAYFLEHGKWPAYVLHSCDNPACCNPKHLREGTHKENIAECWSKGRGHKGKNFEKLPAVREMIAAGARNKDICRALDIKNDAVSRIRGGQIYGA